MEALASAAGQLLPGLDAPPERARTARNSRRARVWREHLERVTGHALAQAGTAAEREAVAAAHREAVARGPDWARIRRGSDYARPVVVKDRNQLDRLLRWFALLERETFAADRAWARHEQRTIRRTIPRTARAILLALVALARKYAVVHPSIERLASMGQMSRRTAVACLDVLEGLGLVTRHRRRRRERCALGFTREVQDASAYVLAMPEGADTGTRSPPPVGRRHQSAKSAQQSDLEGQASKKDRVAAARRTAPALGERAGGKPASAPDWRERSRRALDALAARR
jgi:hypothetical protein